MLVAIESIEIEFGNLTISAAWLASSPLTNDVMNELSFDVTFVTIFVFLFDVR